MVELYWWNIFVCLIRAVINLKFVTNVSVNLLPTSGFVEKGKYKCINSERKEKKMHKKVNKSIKK